MLKLPTMLMDLFNKVLGNVDKNYPFSMSPKIDISSIWYLWYMYHSDRNSFHMV